MGVLTSRTKETAQMMYTISNACGCGLDGTYGTIRPRGEMAKVRVRPYRKRKDVMSRKCSLLQISRSATCDIEIGSN